MLTVTGSKYDGHVTNGSVAEQVTAVLSMLEQRERELHEALSEAVECVGEFVDVSGNEWHDGTTLASHYEKWRAALKE